MSLSGHLEDVSFRQVVAAIAQHRASGVLRLARGLERARVEFRHGRAIRARTPGLAKLGDALVAHGAVDPITVREAARVQAEGKRRRSLEEVLLASGVVDEESLRTVLDDQVEQAMRELATWASGRFEFISDEPNFLEAGSASAESLVALNMSPITFDTASDSVTTRAENRTAPASNADLSTHQAIASEDPTPGNLPALGGEARERGLWLEVVTPDDGLFELLHEMLPTGNIRPMRVAPQAVERRTEVQAPATVLLLDLRRGEWGADQIAPLRQRRPGVPILALVDARPDIRRAYQGGALAVMPAEPEVICAALLSLSAVLAPAPSPMLLDSLLLRPPSLSATHVGESAPPTLSATVSLELMRAVSEAAERAVLFLARGERLGVGGAFGFGAEGKPLAELTHALAFPIEEAGALAEGLRAGRTQHVDFEAPDLPATLLAVLGSPPLTGRGVALPIPGQNGGVAVIYADNDQIDREIEDLEVLELAADQVGPQLENELLVQEVSRSLT